MRNPKKHKMKKYIAYIESIEKNSDTYEIKMEGISENNLEINKNNESICIINLQTSVMPKFHSGRWVRLKIADNGFLATFHFLNISENSNEQYKVKINKIDRRKKEWKHLNIQINGFKYYQSPILKDIKSILAKINKNNYRIKVYDIGQGNWNSVVKDKEDLIFFDIGTGNLQNQHTFKSRRLPDNKYRLIILSHWDTDHYFGYFKDKKYRNYFWLAPNNIQGPVASQVALDLISNNKLYLVSKPGIFFSSQTMKIIKNKNILNKNNSGLFITFNLLHGNYLLPGDSHYSSINKFNFKIDKLIASHHGGFIINPPPKNTKVQKSINIVFSFGYKNSYKHPVTKMIKKYQKFGWNNKANTNQNGDIIF